MELLNRLERTLRESPSRLLVPEVTGLPVDDAVRELRAARIPEVAVRGPRDGGVVAEQVPRPGNHLADGAPVELVLTPRPEAAAVVTTVVARPQRVTTPSVVVPSLVDLEWRQAKEVLRRAGLPVRREARFAEWGADWVVIGQTPAAGVLVAPGSSVEVRFVLPGPR